MAKKASPAGANAKRKSSETAADERAGETSAADAAAASDAPRPEARSDPDAPEKPGGADSAETPPEAPDAADAAEDDGLTDDAAKTAEPSPGADAAERDATDADSDAESGPEEDQAQDAATGAGASDGDARDGTQEGAGDDADRGDDGRDGTTPPVTDPTAPAPAVTEQITVRKGGFVPLVLGGLVAGGIGFGAAYYVLSDRQATATATIGALRDEMQQALGDQSDRVSALSDRLDATEPPDLSGLRQAQSKLQQAVADLSNRLADSEDRRAELEKRLTALEKRPVTDAASDTAVAAYEAELKALQEAMATQRAEIEGMVAEARQNEATAKETAQATRRRAALSRIRTALDTGSGYAGAAAELETTGVEVPESLSQMADKGVATLAELQENFPDAARRALAAARDAALKTGEPGGVADFLRGQLGVRSLEPRQGNDPDAILSRAEAATRAGRLKDALSEIGTLPDVARAELSEWIDSATRRLDALSAMQSLSEELN